MKTKLRLLALVFAVATISLQCSTDKDETPTVPSVIEQFFKAGTFAHEGKTLNYQECDFQSSLDGPSVLVVVLHGQYANGSDNVSQLRQDAMIKVWQYLYSCNIKAMMLAPQCPMGYDWDEDPAKTSRVTMSEYLKALIEHYVVRWPSIDLSRIYIMGYSDAYKPAGAGGVWRMLSEYPDMFAAGMVVASNPDDSISPAKVAKTPVLFVKGESDIYATSTMLDSFADWVHDEGGIMREDVIRSVSREELCREAFSTERLDWVMQYSRK